MWEGTLEGGSQEDSLSRGDIEAYLKWLACPQGQEPGVSASHLGGWAVIPPGDSLQKEL